jgi:conjugal transfer ATP-binding protein TraC
MFGKKGAHSLTPEELAELEKRRALEAQREELKNRVKYQKQHEAKEEKRRQEEEKRKNAAIFISSTQYSIPVRDIYRGIVITRDHRFVKIMEFKPLNFQMLPNEKRNQIANGFAGILSNTQYRLQFKTLSTKARTDSLVTLMKKQRSKEKNEMRARLQDEYINLIHDTALSQGVSRRFFIIIEFAPTADNDGTNIDAIVWSLNAAAQEIENEMNALGNSTVVTNSLDNTANLQELFWSLLNRRTAEEEPFSTRVNKILSIYDSREDIPAERKRNIPATDMIAPPWIDFTHPRHVVVCGTKGDEFDRKTGKQVLKNKFYTFAYLNRDTYPMHVAAGWMDTFINMAEGIDCDIFVEPVPAEKIEEKVGLQVRMQRAKLHDSSDTNSDYSKTMNAIDSGMFILDGIGSGEKFFYVSVLLTVVGDTRENMEFRYKELRRAVKSDLGAELVRPDYQMEKAFCSALPLCRLDPALYKKMRHNILTRGLSTMYPFLTYEMQDPNGIMMGVNKANNSLVSVDVFDTDTHPNANGAILGESGYGKTYTAQLLAMRWCLLGIQTFIITPMKGSEDYLRACTQIDGQFVQLGPGSQSHINVFDISIPDSTAMEELEGESAGLVKVSLLDQKVQSLHTFMHLVVKDITLEEDNIIDKYIYKAYHDRGITADNESVFIPGTRRKKDMPILEDVYDLIRDVPELRRVYNIMTPIVHGSLNTYNHATDVNLDNKYIVFDLGGKEGEDLSLPMYIVLDFVWGRIKENKLDKKAVLVDEAWQLIGSHSNVLAAEYVRQIFKTIRAFGGSAFVMTQQVKDFFALDNGSYGTAIINNADTKILLHMSPDDCEQMQSIMHLTNAECEKIEAQKKGEGMVSTGGARLFVKFKSSPFEHQVITTDPKELRAKLEKEKAEREAMQYRTQQNDHN